LGGGAAEGIAAAADQVAAIASAGGGVTVQSAMTESDFVHAQYESRFLHCEHKQTSQIRTNRTPQQSRSEWRQQAAAIAFFGNSAPK
jgi:hypothetical protein